MKAPLAASGRVGESGCRREEAAMGTLRGDNGGERPQDGHGLPGLPPEWGTVIIPDDASELDTEGATVRRRFRREARQVRWRRRFHLPPPPVRRLDDDSPGL